MRSLDIKMASFSGPPPPELPDDLIDELEGHAHPNEIQEPVRIYIYKYIFEELLVPLILGRHDYIHFFLYYIYIYLLNSILLYKKLLIFF